ncbi:bifunctional ligase/repressor BirA [Anaplasma platys]|uniref:biotin--[biotin carboxyl-carrier protein] ligase n=1 Tax=Anaplasma platys TaxID=949 RepID=A0A858PYR1_9RICK|nr:biotin--[acetyl-CoA-carboxylase] ligase [Anaplasma platys]QJC27704.1 bifunctional ligase/repressor BirA [Anaplasma platys]
MQPYAIHHVAVTQSTNLDAITLAENGAPSGTVVIADEQTSGSGRRGRLWSSPKGNLYFSIVIRVNIELPAISFLGAIAAGITIEEILTQHSINTAQLRYKWPNDVLIDDKKICGILLNLKRQGKTMEWIVCGIGINILSYPEHATSISSYVPNMAPSLSNVQLLHSTLENFSKLMDILSVSGFDALRQLWLKKAYKLNSEINVVTSANTKYRGKFVDIDNNGSIVLEQKGKLRKIEYGEMI